MSVSAEAPPAREPGDPRSPAAVQRAGSGPKARPARPLVVTGGIAAFAAAASGLAALTTLTAIGWITAPHVGVGTGLGGVLRTAALLWLVAHHVGVTVHGAGRIGLLPLGLVLLPGALLAIAGRWVVRAGAVTRLRHVGYAAIALALPYTLLAGALALASRSSQAAPSLWQAVVASFLLALVAGGLGAARGLAPWSRLARLMPARPRSVILGMLGASALLTAAGAALAGAIPVHPPAGGQGGHRRARARHGRRGAAPARPAGLRAERDHLGRRLRAGSRVRVRRRDRGRADRLGARRAPGLPDAGRPALGTRASLDDGPGPGHAVPGRDVRGHRDRPGHAHAGDRGGGPVGLRGGRGHRRPGRPGGGVRRRPAR